MIRRGLLLLVGSVAVLFFGASMAQGAASPAWSVTAAPYPTNFVAGTEGGELGSGGAARELFGPAYHIVAVNVGGAATAGEFTITDTLPATVTPTLAAGGRALHAKGSLPVSVSCSRSGQTVTCSGETPAVEPGELIEVTIPVKVKTGGAKTYENTVTATGGGAAPVSGTAHSIVSDTPATFGFLSGRSGFFSSATEEDGSPATSAGGHPAELNIGLGFPNEIVPNGEKPDTVLATGGGLRDARVVLPRGVVANPQATVKCKEAELETETETGTACPIASQVGTVTLSIGISKEVTTSVQALYNMQAPGGSPGVFGFEVVSGVYEHLIGSVRSDGSYELAATASDTLAEVAIQSVQTSLWGEPSSSSHDAVRGPCIRAEIGKASCPVEATDPAFLTLPSRCSGPLTTRGEIDSWRAPGIFSIDAAASTGLGGEPVGIDGCSELEFTPSIAVRPDSASTDSASGLAVDVHVPQSEAFGERAASTLEGAKVVLPEGFAVNPSAANGRTACTAAQIGLVTPVGQSREIHFSDSPASCPDAAKVGSAEVDTPLLDHPLPGGVYLAQPYENPFGSLLAIYIAVYDPVTGVVVKLAGHVEADPVTGQLTTTFAENPELPFEDFQLTFFTGPRAALRTPMTCGEYSAQSTLSPWSGTTPVSLTNSVPISQAAGGGPCAGAPGQEPNNPSFSAGTVNPLAGAYSPFVLHLSREDGSQQFSGLNVTLPPGLTGRLAGTPYCPDSALAAAEKKSGGEEQASPSCPPASEVGHVTVGAGSGSMPFYATGRAYLAGPYKGDPLSLAIITPAVAGPYDLGTVVVRAALHVDLETAQITVHSDPLPTILKGIPLDVRSIAVEVAKPQFTLNPTSCEPMALGAESVSMLGQAAHLSNRFQVGSCGRLGFKPKVQISLKGGTKRTGHPALKAVVTYPKQGEYANIARAQVALPHSEFLDQNNIGRACTRPVLAAHACPAKSIYGKVKAWTPLLEKPLEGPVYLVGGYGYKLPALVAELNGQIRVLLIGRIDTGKQKGIRNTFETVPDAPVSRFVLEMKGGKKYGLLENSENICSKPQRANASLVAQSGKRLQLRPLIANSCKGGKKAKNKKRRHRR
ncbi:MAG: hypothetical protein JWO14_3914 [Solirubrobacterales bacterium]|nr:hypothetical protein [Solirubrobacterales bacterium]